MTEKQLQQLGFSLTNRKRVFHPSTETEFNLRLPLRNMSVSDFIDLFHTVVYTGGVEYGKFLKAQEIKKTLGI